MPPRSTEHRDLSGPAYRGEFVSRYDRLRPRPPPDLIALLRSVAPTQPPRLVVDLGSGTGISTVAWADDAARIIGIEHNDEMIAAARRAPNVEYHHAAAHDTGLPAACADVVTCAQSLHWMDPEATLAEVAHVLRPRGIFAVYDYDWPPFVQWEIDEAFLVVIRAGGVDPSRPEKSRHLERLRGSGRFRWVRELCLHGREPGSADHVARLPLAFGPVARRLSEGASEQELGLAGLRRVAERVIGADATTLWWSYRVYLAVK